VRFAIVSNYLYIVLMYVTMAGMLELHLRVYVDAADGTNQLTHAQYDKSAYLQSKMHQVVKDVANVKCFFALAKGLLIVISSSNSAYLSFLSKNYNMFCSTFFQHCGSTGGLHT